MAANDNDAFTALGTITVDEAALVASLAEAEKRVRASVDRQAQSFESFALRAKKAAHDTAMRGALIGTQGFAPGEYQRKFGGLDAATARATAQAGREAGVGLEEMTEKTVHAGHAMKQLLGATLAFVPGAGYFRQHLNQMTGGIFKTGGELTKTTMLLGGATVGLAIGAMAISHYVQNINRLSEAQFNANRAIASLDMTKATTAFTDASDAINRWKHDLSTAGDRDLPMVQRWLGAMKGGWFELSGELAASEKEQQAAAEAVRVLFEKVEVPKHTIEMNKQAADTMKMQGERMVAVAQSADEVAAGYEIQAVAAKRLMQTELDQLDLQKKIALANLQGRDGAQVAAQFDDKRAAAIAKAGEAQKRLTDAATQARATEALAMAEHQAKLEKNTARRATSFDEERASIVKSYELRRSGVQQAIALGVNVQENTRKLAEMESDQAIALAEHKIKEISVVRQAAEANIAAEGRKVKAREATRDALAKIDAEIAQTIAQVQGTGVDVTSRAAEQTRQRTALIEAIKQEKAAEEDTFRAGKHALEAKIALGIDVRESREELARLEQEHATKSVEIAEDTKRRQAELDKSHLDQRRQDFQTLASLQSETVDRMFRVSGAPLQAQLKTSIDILGQATQGTKRWWEQMSQVADKAREVRDAAKGVFQTLFSEAENRLKEKGKTVITKSEIEREVAAIEKERELALRDYGSGRGIKVGTLLPAMNTQDTFRTLNTNFGGNLSSAFETATMTPNQIVKMRTGFETGFESVSVVVDKFVVDTKAKMDALGGELGGIVADKLSDTIARALDLEGRRGPSSQGSQ